MAKQNNKRQFLVPEYASELSSLSEFLAEFRDNSIVEIDNTYGQRKYMIELQRIANRQTNRIDIYVEDLEYFFNDRIDFVNKIKTNTLSYQRLLYDACDTLMPQQTRDFEQNFDLFDEEINVQRQQNMEQDGNNNHQKRLPPELIRRYQLFIIRGPQTKQQVMAIRNLKAQLIGSLITIKAMVVRTSEVRPQIIVACFSCDACGYENYQTVHGKTFTPMLDCASDKCRDNKVRGRLIFNHGSSKFISNQEIKIQELKEQLPKGSIPRAFTVMARGDSNIRICSPGDMVTIQGVFLPVEKEGFFANKASFYSTYIEAFHIKRDKKKFKEIDIESVSGHKIFEDIKKYPFSDLYMKLAKSIAPEIFGMEDVKKALLLMIVGGVSKEMHDGLKIRGDINVALIGDPGVAKSQLLRYISQVSPRGVYTTGKGSSSVGLTAAVIRDPITGEMALEGGALVMADRGVCCIDEFDKMNESDRTAIHEVMEQQTVSIAKAGITTTLNARTSILAAANPLYGRYNKKQTPHQNINLPAALLSRFDLIFILLDEINHEADTKLASHIGRVHQNKYKENETQDLYSVEEITTFVALSKQYEPILTSDIHQYIADQYVERRKQTFDKTLDGYSYTTPRTLLAIIRLSQSIAKLQLADRVTQRDVEEAIRLMDISQESVRRAQQIDDTVQRKDKTAKLYELLSSLCNKNKGTITKDSFVRQAISKGSQMQEIEEFLNTYSSLNQIQIHGDQNDRITLVS
ncbi:unnamed protein product (macronuclear) [Paramecium tetraurelia]|uniref:DNA replication licensing factor MCM7 n=1 Tax=Paramecium tetraurelia TaxID=5888 RepID=A0DAC7_PARTE|nr:uncharacterized protein GSPATT00014901001 [Paramecium tetraurelia]CAK79994.1 unnamed protein product [Paramecium tetraurelia]|eukprot:XP_001447391.1 hypothetical protein (macronuclear) [Paramecium tetraurelia strain d4-2]